MATPNPRIIFPTLCPNTIDGSFSFSAKMLNIACKCGTLCCASILSGLQFIRKCAVSRPGKS